MSSIFTVHRQPYGEVMNPISPDSVRFHDKNGNVTEVRMVDGMVNIHVGGVTVSAEHLEDLIRQMAKPPAEAQPVAWEWEYIGGDHYPRGHKVARSLREMDPTNPPHPETWRPTRPLIYGDTAPPSAPVGVEEVVRKVCERLDKVADYAHTIDDETVVVALSNLPAVLDRALSEALAQQPAAVDSEMVIRAVNAYDEATGEGWQMPCLQGMRAALTAALAAQQGGES